MIAWWRRHAVFVAFALLTWVPALVQWALVRRTEYLALALLLALVWIAGASAWVSRRR